MSDISPFPSTLLITRLTVEYIIAGRVADVRNQRMQESNGKKRSSRGSSRIAVEPPLHSPMPNNEDALLPTKMLLKRRPMLRHMTDA